MKKPKKHTTRRSPQESTHFLRVCLSCGGVWFGLHCPHDGRQNPCPWCDRLPTPIANQPVKEQGDADPKTTNSPGERG